MKKSYLTPKEIAKKRLAKSKLMKIELHERDLHVVNKENASPQLPTLGKSCYRVHDRVTEDFGPRNPFDIPDIHRLFSKSKAPMKTKPEPFIMSEPHTICDIDATFYKKVEGRPLRQFDDIKVYMRNIRDITLFKANTAYLNDQILQIDRSLTVEMEEYLAIDKLFIKTKNNFVQFAKESYRTAKEIQKKAADKAMELDNATEELESLSFKYVAVRNKLGVISITLQTLTKYRQFLFTLSPLTWRQEFDKAYIEGRSGRNSLVEEQRESRYSVNAYIKAMEDAKPILFFKKPRQMDLIFNNLSRQCLAYMEIEVQSSSLVNSVIKSRDYLKAQALQEIDEVKDFVETFRGHVEFMTIKEQEYKTHFEKILLEEFQELYASYDVSKLFTCLQYTNTQVFHGPEDPKDSITSLMLHLEKEYIYLTSGLDHLNQEVVKAATNEFFSQDIKMMKDAHLAQRSLKECDILSKALFTSFEPPRMSSKSTKGLK